ncbi:hypothetical protein LUU34_00511800 [Aix galericulata]|nr:hypothetical protein LUU34_00511800 [Aix galericulata]
MRMWLVLGVCHGIAGAHDPSPPVKRSIAQHLPLLHRLGHGSNHDTLSSSRRNHELLLAPTAPFHPARKAPAESRQRGGPRRWGRASNMAEQPQSHQSHQSQALGAGSEGCKALGALLSGIAQAAYHGNAALTAELLRGQLYPEAAPEEFAALRAKMGGLLQVPLGWGLGGSPGLGTGLVGGFP